MDAELDAIYGSSDLSTNGEEVPISGNKVPSRLVSSITLTRAVDMEEGREGGWREKHVQRTCEGRCLNLGPTAC